MGLNYYLVQTEPVDIDRVHQPPKATSMGPPNVFGGDTAPPVDGNPLRILHLTKFSAGWRPTLHWYYGAYFTTIEELRELVFHPKFSIVDEYGRTWSPRLFWEKLQKRAEQSEKSHLSEGFRDRIAATDNDWEFQEGVWS